MGNGDIKRDENRLKLKMGKSKNEQKQNIQDKKRKKHRMEKIEEDYGGKGEHRVKIGKQIKREQKEIMEEKWNRREPKKIDKRKQRERETQKR